MYHVNQEQLDALKNKQTKNESQITLFIEDSFFDKAKAYLKYQTEMQLGIKSEEPMLSKWEKSTVIRKQWAYSDNSIITQNKRKAVPKRDIHNVLSLAHNGTAHRGRQITSKWISNNYSEVNVKVVAIFVGLCPIHAEQQSVTSRVKLVDRVDKTSPLHSNLLLGKVEEIVNTYARVVTKFGRINTLISPTRLYPCTATTQNIELDYTTELTFSAACKKAM